MDTSIHKYFGKEKAPRISVVIKDSSHFTQKNLRFLSLWMNVWFSLHLKNDLSMIPIIWGPESMRGSLAGDRDSLSIQFRPQLRLSNLKRSVNGDVRGIVKNLKDFDDAKLCIYDIDENQMLDGIFLKRNESRFVGIAEGRRRIALVNLVDGSALYSEL